MNENTLKVRIKETENKLNETFDPGEQAILSEELKDFKRQLKNLTIKKKEPKLKTNIDAPIIGDRKPSSNYTDRPSISPSTNDTFIVGI